MEFPSLKLPPCVFCRASNARDITPEGAPDGERWYECVHCGRHFAVKFNPLPLPPRPAAEHPRCAVCGSTRTDRIEHPEDRDRVVWLHCSACGHRWCVAVRSESDDR
jgi:hypothetical protein